MRSRLALLLLLAAAPALGAPTSPTGPGRSIVLYTMGPGDELFSAFGHAAICVEGAPAEDEAPGRCFNYGTADFQTPVPLTWDFVRGRARFWVSVWDRDAMLAFYERADRSIYRQVLPLAAADVARTAAALVASTDERVRYYRYHHFNDNCTTRIRDLLDSVSGGRLHAGPKPRGRSFRAFARDGFAGNWPLLAATDLLLGHPADRETDTWAAMFLPSELRAEVSRRFGAPVEVLHERGRALPSGPGWAGGAAFAALGVLLAMFAWLGARGRPTWRGLSLTAIALTLGLLGVILWSLAALSSFPELRWNEALLAFWPTDLALPALSPRRRTGYAALRVLVLALLALAHLVGLSQPLAPLLLPALPFAALLALGRRRA